MKSKLLGQLLLYIAIQSNTYFLPFQYNYTSTRNAKRLKFSQTLVSSLEYIILCEMKIWKTLQWLAAAAKSFSWEKNFS